ncbi:MAG: DNA polymerase IV [Candidatus Omnitrophica bacterium]|nr:DNA polymerase IV [Candidatus Omnitrophota bacterium]
MILHIDMDAFFASIEQTVNPRLKGRPLIVGTRENKLRTVVCAASYEAKALGISSGMPAKEAFQICPDLEFVPAEQARYIWTSERIFDMLKSYGFRLNYASIDEFQMDITGTASPEILAGDIQQRIQSEFNITASIGIAKNWILSKLGSKLKKPNGITVITETNLQGILARTPVEKICGVGPKTAPELHALGIISCLDLYQKSASFLEQILGKFGLNLYLSLHSTERFEDSEEEQKPKSIGHSYTLKWASETPGFIRAWIRLLSEMVASRLRQQNLSANTVHLWLNGPEIGNFSAQKTYSQATNDGYEICHRCLKIMAKIALKTPKIRALGVTCGNLIFNQNLALLAEEKQREGLLKAMDKLHNRYGSGCIYPAIINLAKKE